MRQILRSWLLSTVALTLVACEPRSIMPARALEAPGALSNYAAMTRNENKDLENFYKLVFGKDDFVSVWDEVERYRSGNAADDRMPYQDSWYPYTSGGTNVRGALNLYDRAFYSGDSKAADWEARNHAAAQKTEENNWFGHCNGASAASIRYKSPQRSVNRPAGCTAGQSGCVVFTTEAIRALLAEISMNVYFKFLSSRKCNLTKDELSRNKRTDPLNMNVCDDINPAVMHLALVNFMGRMEQPLIHDQNRDNQIWNYPIHSYLYTASALSENDASVAVDGVGGPWTHNPDARFWYRVHMAFSYRSFDSSFSRAGTVPTLSREDMDYVLELDAERRVIGGEWVGASVDKHPDFIWMSFEPQETMEGGEDSNPYVKPSEVTKIWAESVGLNPNNPFPTRNDPNGILFYPFDFDLQWGSNQGYYYLILDGKRSGAAFRGKATQLRVRVVEPKLKTDATLELLVNGSSVGKVSIKDEIADFTFNSSAGINNLSLRWSSPSISTSAINQSYRYYAM